MITGSLCLTEILKSRKPCSSNRLASHNADSTSASGVALPYFASSRLSSEPALTPIRMEQPASVAALAISPTLSSNALMLPGLTRTAAQPASMAAKTYFGWKWMSAITGICDFRAIAGSASASSCDGTATRTIWQPAAVSSAICWSVAFTSVVGVVVIDWTEIGASPPTGIEPTRICRLLRRGASTGGGTVGMPRDTAVTGRTPLLEGVGERVHDVGQDGHHRDPAEDHDDQHRERDQLVEVDRTGVAPAERARQPRPGLLEPQHRDVAAVQRQQREEVEDADEDVEAGQQQHEDERGAGLDGLAAGPRRTDHAHRPVRIALLAGQRPEQRRHLLREVRDRRRGRGEQRPGEAGALADRGERAEALGRRAGRDPDGADRPQPVGVGALALQRGAADLGDPDRDGPLGAVP